MWIKVNLLKFPFGGGPSDFLAWASNWLIDCLLHGVTSGCWPWISLFGSLSNMVREAESDPTVTTAYLGSTHIITHSTITYLHHLRCGVWCRVGGKLSDLTCITVLQTTMFVVVQFSSTFQQVSTNLNLSHNDFVIMILITFFKLMCLGSIHHSTKKLCERILLAFHSWGDRLYGTPAVW